MYSPAKLAFKYFVYYLTASNGKGHGVHSPFVFEFITQVLNNDREYYCYKTIEQLRHQLKHNNTLLVLEDLGAGSRVDLAFIDGNHRKEPTLKYFNEILTKTTESSILIFDDIHWSREMEEAWQNIKAHPSVTLSIDLFFIGIIFFRKEQKVKQHFAIRF